MFPSALSALLLLLPLLTIAGPTASRAEGISVEDVNRALALDTIIVGHLKSYLEEVFSEGDESQHHGKNNTQVQHVMRYIAEHEEMFGSAGTLETKDTESMDAIAAADPLKSLVLTRRLAKDWPALLKLAKGTRSYSSAWDKITSSVLEKEKDLAVMMKDDHLGILSTSFARLINVYRLDPHQLISLRSRHKDSPFSADLRILDALFIGDAAFDEKMYGTAVELLSAVKELLQNQTSDVTNVRTARNPSDLLRQVQHLINLASTLHDLRLHAEGYKQQQGMFPLPLTQVPISLQREEEKDSLPDPITEYLNLPTDDKQTEEDLIRYAQLCRGHTLMSLAERSQLKCRLDALGSPYLLLMPALVEENSVSPRVLTFHRVLTHNQIQQITGMARPMLEQATTREDVVSTPENAFKIRSSFTAWLREDTLPVLKDVNRKVAVFTGMDVDEKKVSAEVLQANLYAAGGHYTPHMDAFNFIEIIKENRSHSSHEMAGGDRIATFMFYMNDVEAGGYTVFPRIGIGVRPTAGSAVFWLNLLPDGSQDTRTLHGACPVLKGTKWVCNKWIRYDQQFQLRPCPLDYF